MITPPTRRDRARALLHPTVADIAGYLLGPDPRIAVRGYDNSSLGPANAPATLVVRSPDAIRRMLTAPNELGLARAYVAGDLDLEGDLFALLDLRHEIADLHTSPASLAAVASLALRSGIRFLPPPPEEVRLRGRRHSKARDGAAISHHYDVSNDFYRLFLGPTMAYSCAVWDHPDRTVDPSAGLDAAQEAKFDLVARKLGLQPGMRLLDVGCGWGGMLLHAAQRYGVDAVGATISVEQATAANDRITAAGLEDRVTVRVQDYREMADGPYDAISSIGMCEHVGSERVDEYVADLFELLSPGGRLLNHGITRPPGAGSKIDPNGFMGRYVFPDGELFEIGELTTALQRGGFEVRHVESLREHYAATLRAWLANLEANWTEAVSLVGLPRARVWRLYLAGCAVSFDDGRNSIHQVLAVKPDSRGNSGMSSRPTW